MIKDNAQCKFHACIYSKENTSKTYKSVVCYLTTSELRVLSQDRVLYKRFMQINKIGQTALALEMALMTLALVQ